MELFYDEEMAEIELKVEGSTKTTLHKKVKQMMSKLSKEFASKASAFLKSKDRHIQTQG